MTSGPPDSSEVHQPVLLAAVLHWLKPEEGGVILDCTLGLGGHSEAMLAASPELKVIGLDRDAESMAIARRRLAGFGDRIRTEKANFKDFATVLDQMNISEVRAILADLGINSSQLDNPERGFSFQQEGPLDMRLDQTSGETAADLVNSYPESELADLIYQYGEDKASRRIARAIVRERDREPITTTGQLAQIVVRAVHQTGHWKTHPATRTFQALRIAVNQELTGLDVFIKDAVSRLSLGGRLAIISFHSLEDRAVKRAFRLESGICQCDSDSKDSGSGRSFKTKRHRPIAIDDFFLRQLPSPDPTADPPVCAGCGAKKRVEILTRKPIGPPPDEVSRNPRSRSAKLRVCERI